MRLCGTTDLTSLLDQHDAEGVSVRQRVRDERAVALFEDMDTEVDMRKEQRVKREDRYPVCQTPSPSREALGLTGAPAANPGQRSAALRTCAPGGCRRPRTLERWSMPPGRAVVARPLAHGVVVHYHEIGLKGRNRGFFERRLVDNLRGALRTFAGRARRGDERAAARPDAAGRPSDELLDAVARTFGVAFLAPCAIVASDIDGDARGGARAARRRRRSGRSRSRRAARRRSSRSRPGRSTSSSGRPSRRRRARGSISAPRT